MTDDGHSSRVEPGERRWLHAVWEAALLVLLVGGVAVWWLLGRDTDALGDLDLLGDRLYGAAPFLVLATALAVSLRVRAPNLAVGAVAALAAVLFVEWEGQGALVAAGIVLAAAVAVGLALAVLVTAFRIPGWAASLGAIVAAMATVLTIARHNEDQFPLTLSVGGSLAAVPESTAVTVAEEAVWPVVLAVVAGSVLGGAVGMLPAVRRRLRACREVAAGTGPRTRSTALTTSGALLVSSLLAAAAGVLLVLPSSPVTGGAIPAGAYEPLGVALPLAIVLLGGTTLGGMRGGVFGTFLAALVMFAGFAAFADLGWSGQSHWVTVGALALGLLVSRMVEALGTTRSAPAPGSPPEPQVGDAPPEPAPAAAGSEPETGWEPGSAPKSEPGSAPKSKPEPGSTEVPEAAPVSGRPGAPLPG